MSADHAVRDPNRLQNRSRKEAGRGCYVNNPYAISASSQAAPLPPVTYLHPVLGAVEGSMGVVDYNTTFPSQSNAHHHLVVRPHLLPTMPQQARPPQLLPGPPHTLPSLGARPQALKSLRTTVPTAAHIPFRNHAPFAMIAHKFDSQRYAVPKGVELAAGDVVVVDGDRGMNLGVVERLLNKAPHYKVENNVVRIASEHDCEALRQQRLEEEAVRLDVQQLADNMSTNMCIRGIEYQYDRQKMTVFYSAPSAHVDFRRLQRVLYSRYGCRIWIKDFKEKESATPADGPPLSSSSPVRPEPYAVPRHPDPPTAAHTPKLPPQSDSKRRKSSVVESM